MPFSAKVGGNIVWPDETENDANAECPECGGPMHVRKSHRTRGGVFKPRCFVHNRNSPSGCSGGESDEHKQMKYIVSRNFGYLFENAKVTREKWFDSINRRADVCVEFDQPQFPFGRGVIGEVQYRNESKDIEAVTNDFLRTGYSICWIGEDAFSCGFQTLKLPEITKAWPNAIPPAEEWSGYEEPIIEMQNIEPSCYPIPVSMPTEYMEEHRENLHDYWKLGAGDLDYDLVNRLSQHSAGRACATCGERADYYLYKGGIVSTFRCVKHARVGKSEI